MIKKLILISAMGLLFSGCYMAPLALVGPATSGFTATSMMQSAVTSSANHIIKKTTGKSFSDYASEFVKMNNISLGYFPLNESKDFILPLPKPLNIN